MGEQQGHSLGEQHVCRVVSVGVQHGQQSNECDVRTIIDELCESDAKPKVDMSVAGLSPVCTVGQSEARLTVFANLWTT